MTRSRRHRSQAGATMVEFLFIGVLLFLVMFASLEFDRMLFVYTALADAAKAGVRYGVVRGSNRSSGSLSSGDTTEIQAHVKSYVLAVNKTRLNVAVTYPDGANSIGSRISVVVQYTYDPWVGLPLTGVTLSATSQGVITW
jgi:Flp pilus assembly protein TadG